MLSLRNQVLLFVLLISGIVLGSVALLQWSPQGGSSLSPGASTGSARYLPATYVGRASCIDCHEQEQNLWTGSHHDLAMQVANEQTVLGDFDDATFTYFGVTSRFYKKDGKFFVNTDGPDGLMHDYEITYTFGVTPLQQYLIGFPDGRYQALGLSWDSRPADKGGQRWYHLYPEEPIPHDDELHWTGPNQNWNFMCAECHSTNLKKNYNLADNTFNTTWSEINVSCETCHGPSSNHVKWAKDNERGIDRGDPTMGMAFQLKSDAGTWEFPPNEPTAQRTMPREDRTLSQMCAQCHSRRGSLTDQYKHGQDLLDTHRLALLDENLYFPDGQIQDEVYVYGSFLQSKMHQKGVTCTNCHDPHSMQILATGNTLCSQCHLPDKFDTPDHHFHDQGTEESLCVSCHMPKRTYMGVDDRLDHSIRVPRPDLSIKLGTPNACNKCHDEETNEWSEDALNEWYGPYRRNEPHYGETLQAGRTNAPNANKKLAKLANNKTRPGIVRATAISLLRNYPTPLSYRTIQDYAKSEDPLIRFAALSALEATEPALRMPIAFDLLDDPVYLVRNEAGRILSPADPAQLDAVQQKAVEQGIDSYIESQLANAERAESHLNIALIHTQRGQAELAEQAYRTAIRINPRFAQAYVNLADLYRATDRDDQALQLLRQAIDTNVNQGVIHYSLGLALVRQKQIPEAIQVFEHAAELAPDDPQFGYTLGIALNSTGQPQRALEVLTEHHQRHPADQPTLFALMTISRDQQQWDAARQHAQTLLKLNPENPQTIQAFIRQIQQQ
jgi:predicted CXXCH cytochrome family protein